MYHRMVQLGIWLLAGMASVVPPTVLGCETRSIRSTTQKSSAYRQTQPDQLQTDPATTQPSESCQRDLSNEDIDEHVQLITGNITPKTRELGAKKLLQAGTEAASRQLADILQSSTDLAAKHAVCRAIAHFDDPMPSLVEPLLTLLGHEPNGLENEVIEALRRFDAQGVIPRLKSIAQGRTVGNDPAGSGEERLTKGVSLQRRLAVISALGSMGHELSAVAALIDIISKTEKNAAKDETIGSAVLDALQEATGIRHRDRAAALTWWQSHQFQTPLQWLGEVNARCSEEIRLLQAEKAELQQRLVAAYRGSYLQTPDEQRPKKLLELLGDSSAELRGLGLDLINALITDRKDVGQEIKTRLVEMVSDPDSEVRRSVALMVGDLRLTSATERLTDSLTVESDYRLRSTQVRALGRLDDITAIPVLIDRLDDDSLAVSRASVEALGTLARQGRGTDLQIIQNVSEILLKRYGRLGGSDNNQESGNLDELKQQYLKAMGRIGSEAFRSIFIHEMTPERTNRLRRTAIAGLASYEDAAAAEKIRPYLSATEAEIRLAVASALGRCGQSAEDLDALLRHIDNHQESEPSVRERSWESFLAILQRWPPQKHLSAAAQFDQSGDLSVQRRRLDLLKTLKNNQDRYEQLLPPERLNLLDGMADAQFELGEYKAAAKNLESMLAIIKDQSRDRKEAVPHGTMPDYREAEISVRWFTALLRAGQDEAAIASLNHIEAGHANGDETNRSSRPSPWVQVILKEINSRQVELHDATHFSALLKLIELAKPIIQKMAPDQSDLLKKWKSEAEQKRREVVERLLGSLGEDAEAESRLIGFGGQVVIPLIHTKLTAIPATSGPSDTQEEHFIKLAKALMPDWPGYGSDASPKERAAALALLIKGWGTTKSTVLPHPNSSSH